jgi:hypothetical protein
MQHPSTNKITKADAQHVLFFFGSGGVQAGDFTTALFEAIRKADSANFANLALGFPGLCAAWKLAMESDEGINVLRPIADEELATVISIHQARQ